MLKKLKVTQFVIIDTLDLDFDRGLTIFTGETGAGKSIILGAMGLILGEKARPGSIRAGQDKATFEAVFEPPQGHPVWQFLIDKNLAESGQTTFQINRSIEGEDEAQERFVNQKPISEDLLKEIGEYLVEIHGQTANHTLLGPGNQLRLLDMAGAFPQEFYDNVENSLKAVFDKKKALDEEKKFLAKHKGPAARQIDKCVKTFEEIGMADGFLEDLMAKHKVLKTAKDTSDAFQDILGRMIASNGIIGALGGCIKTLERQPLDENKISVLKNALDESIRHARVTVEQIGKLAPEYEIDLNPLNEMEQKISKLEGIAEEFEVEFKDLEDFWREMSDKLSRIQNGRENLNKMNDELIQAKNDYRKHAHILTEKRQEAGEKLAAEITAEFAPLKLEKAQFRVQVEEKPEAPWTKLGFNEVTFLARMNPGQAFSPIAETASGGELARMILALKVVLQRVQTTSTLVFDEVDTGIGGAAAAAVGDRISILSDKTQVIVITHSPQVASRGDQHYHISKRSDSETTISKVTVLTHDERIHELSRMLAGGELTDESQAAAKRLIAEAKEAKSSRQSAA
ncbi:MAG: AAA family ATPase [Pseudomonadota bacterium]